MFTYGKASELQELGKSLDALLPILTSISHLFESVFVRWYMNKKIIGIDHMLGPAGYV
jgi:hypothetical protein